MTDFMLLNPETSSTWGGAIAVARSRETREDESQAIGGLFAAQRVDSDEAKNSELPGVPTAGSTTSEARIAKSEKQLYRVRNSLPLIPRNIQILQQWEGVVSEVGDKDFTVNLNSLTEPDAETLSGEFALDEVSDSDKPMVQPGAVFYWVVGYDKSPAGQVCRVSEIRFRRSPEWTCRRLDAIREEAHAWFQDAVRDEAK